MGYHLMKSRARDPYDITFGGYQILDIRTNGLAGGMVMRAAATDLRWMTVQDWIMSMTTGDR
jgi:hypothetical protein